MAGEDLYGALAGLSYDPTQTGWGMGQQALIASAPTLMNPYASTGSNLGVALGTALMSGLLGYQARQQAAEDSLMANRLGLQLLQASTPEARLGIIEGAPDSDMQSKLLAVNTRLAAQQALTKALVDQEVAKKEGLAKFELGDLGSKLNARELQDALTLKMAERIGTGGVDAETRKKDAEILRYAKMAENIAKRVEALNLTAPEFEIQRRIPGSEAEIVHSMIQGNLANFARLGGNTAQISDVDRNDQYNSLFGPDVPGLGRVTGTSAIAQRIREKIKLAPVASVYDGIGTTTTPGETDAQKRNRELKERLAKLEALAAQRK